MDSWEYLGKPSHLVMDGTPICPKCRSLNVIEQGYDHNHRHHCYDCNVTYWITRN